MTDKEIIVNATTGEITSVPNESDRTFALLQSAVESGQQSPETLEKILDLQQRVMEQQARAAFIDALGQFQASVGPIHKRKEVKDRSGRLMYRFAPLEDIIAQIKPLLTGLGFAVTWDSDQSDKGVDVYCNLRHKAGHSERSHVFIPFTKGHNTNASQDAGLQLAYGKRYALTGVLGIVTADEDGDAGSHTITPLTLDQQGEISDMMVQAGIANTPEAFYAYMNVTDFSEIQQRDYEKARTALTKKIQKASQ